MTGKWRLLAVITAVAGLALTMGASAASAAPAHQIQIPSARMVSSLADIPSAGAAKMVGGKLTMPPQGPKCAVVYMKGSSGDLYLTAEGLNKVVEATSSSRDCWSTATYNHWLTFIFTGSGRCLADNAAEDRVVMQKCANVTWQTWAPIPKRVNGLPSTSYVNEYVVLDQTGGTFWYLATHSLTSGTYVYATGTSVDRWTEWYS